MNIFKSKYSSILDFLGRAEALKSKYTDSLVPSEFNTVCTYAGSYEKAWTWISGLKIQILVKMGISVLGSDWSNWPGTGQNWPETGKADLGLIVIDQVITGLWLAKKDLRPVKTDQGLIKTDPKLIKTEQLCLIF